MHHARVSHWQITLMLLIITQVSQHGGERWGGKAHSSASLLVIVARRMT